MIGFFYSFSPALRSLTVVERMVPEKAYIRRINPGQRRAHSRTVRECAQGNGYLLFDRYPVGGNPGKILQANKEAKRRQNRFPILPSGDEDRE